MVEGDEGEWGRCGINGNKSTAHREFIWRNGLIPLMPQRPHSSIRPLFRSVRSFDMLSVCSWGTASTSKPTAAR